MATAIGVIGWAKIARLVMSKWMVNDLSDIPFAQMRRTPLIVEILAAEPEYTLFNNGNLCPIQCFYCGSRLTLRNLVKAPDGFSTHELSCNECTFSVIVNQYGQSYWTSIAA
jgi:hypothetical protein